MAEIDTNEIQRLLKSSEVRIANLCTATRADGSKFYVYILQNFLQMDAMNKVIQIGASLDFSEFGEVLAYGEGHEPPESVKKEIEEKYQLSHQFEERIREEVKILQEEFSSMRKRGVSETDFMKRKLKDLLTDLKEEK